MRIYLIIFTFFFNLSASSAQILFSESFSVLLDTTKKIKGSVTPELKIQTQKRTLIEFTNMADIALRLKKNSLTIANKVEFNKFGSEVFLSGGYVYASFKENLAKHISIEYFGQVHWAEARGLQRRYAAGPTIRFKIIKKPTIGLFIGTGPMFEYEEWNYEGVPEEKLPGDITTISNRFIKSSSYISYKQWVTQKIFLDISAYHQAKYNHLLSAPRIASSSRFAYQLTDNLQAVLIYQNIYDYQPIVPINNWFHRFIATIAISF